MIILAATLAEQLMFIGHALGMMARDSDLRWGGGLGYDNATESEAQAFYLKW